MNPSMNLMTAQVSFLEGSFAVIHIPLSHYPFFFQAIIRLLLGEDHDEDAVKIPWAARHQFLNVSITPVECSVVCSRSLATRYFEPLALRFNSLLGEDQRQVAIQISDEDFHVIQVDGQGLEAGQRVLELTYPLALAGISILFETTYFSDYILVPRSSIHLVVRILQERGFTFASSAAAYGSKHSLASCTTSDRPHVSRTNTSLDSEQLASSATLKGPGYNIRDLQRKTFARLRRCNTTPSVDPSIRLVSCAARREESPALDDSLRSDLLQLLLAISPVTAGDKGEPQSVQTTEAPDFSSRFLSLTLTAEEPISILLESRLLFHPQLSLSSALLFSRAPTTTVLSSAGNGFLNAHMDDTWIAIEPNQDGQVITPPHGKDNDEDILVPITLDLRKLPFEATGIVCGVAGRLAQGSATTEEFEVLPASKTGDPSVGQDSSQQALQPLAETFDLCAISPEASTISPGRERGTKIQSSRLQGEHSRASVDSGKPGTRREFGDIESSATTDMELERASGGESSRGSGTAYPALDIFFLSTARASTVIVRESDLSKAMRALELDHDGQW